MAWSERAEGLQGSKVKTCPQCWTGSIIRGIEGFLLPTVHGHVHCCQGNPHLFCHYNGIDSLKVKKWLMAGAIDKDRNFQNLINSYFVNSSERQYQNALCLPLTPNLCITYY